MKRTSVSAPASGDFDYWYVLPLTKGQTIELTSTADPALEAFSIVWAAELTMTLTASALTTSLPGSTA